MRYLTRWAVLTMLVITLGVGSAARGQGDWSVRAALDQAPADASMIILVPSLSGLSDKIAALDARLNLGMPELGGVLAEVKRQVGLKEGLRDDGPAMVALSLAEGAGVRAQGGAGGARINRLLFMPTADPAAMRAALGAEAQGVSAIRLRDGHSGFATDAGNFTVIADQAALLEGYRPGQAGERIIGDLGTVGRAALNRSDVVVILHGEGKAQLLQALQAQGSERVVEGMRQIEEDPDAMRGMGGMGGAGGAGGAGGMADMGRMMGQQMLTQMMNQANDAIDPNDPLWRDSEAVLLGLDVSDTGIGLSVTTQMRAGTPSAAGLGEGGGAADLLARLPEGRYLYAQAVSLQGVDVANLPAQVRDTAVPAGDWLRKLIVEIGPAGGVKGFAAATYLGAAPVGGGMMGMAATTPVTCVVTDDPAAFVAAMKGRIEQLNQPAAAAGQRPGQGMLAVMAERPVASAQYLPNKLQLDGRSLDQFVVRYQALPPQMMGAMAMLGGMGMGGGDQTGYVVQGEKMVIIIESADLTAIRNAMAGVKPQGGLGSAGKVAQVRRQLLEAPSVEMYVDLNTVFEGYVQPLLMMFPLPIQPPNDLDPVALQLQVKDGGIAFRAFAPAPVVQYVAETATGVTGAVNPMMGPAQPQGMDHRRGHPMDPIRNQPPRAPQ